MITTNTGAKKMEGTDEWRQIVATSGGAHNDTVDAYDRHIEALQDSLGIVVNGKQAAVNATTGQYVILRNSTIVDSGTDMLPDGLYTAAKAISANTDIDKSYLTAVSNGGLNSLSSKIENKVKIITVGSVSFTNGAGSASVPGVTTNNYVFPFREQSASSSIILTAICGTNGTVTFGAYNTANNGENYTGTVTNIRLLVM